jgi:hypothetical protein
VQRRDEVTVAGQDDIFSRIGALAYAAARTPRG